MATLRTTNLQHPDSSVPNLVLQADGTIGGEALSKFGLGGNVVQTVKTDTFVTTSATYTPLTSFEVTITPTSSSSKVLLLAQVSVGPEAIQRGYLRLRRNGTAISGALGDSAGSRDQSTISPFGNSSNDIHSVIVAYLDSPATTSATTYDFDIRTISTTTVAINRSVTDANNANTTRLISTLTAIEVAA